MGDTHFDSIVASGNISVGGDLNVSGAHNFFDNLTISADKKLLLRDANISVNSSADGQMDIDADVEVEITAPTIQEVATTLHDIDGGALDIDLGAGKPFTLDIADQTTTNGAGGGIIVNAGKGNGAGAGGGIGITAGQGGATGTGGSIAITAGAGGATSGNAGSVIISAGIPVDGDGGDIVICATDGVGTDRSGGDIFLLAGVKTGAGVSGQIKALSSVLLDQGNELRFRQPTEIIHSPSAGTLNIEASGSINIIGEISSNCAIDTTDEITAKRVEIQQMEWLDDFIEAPATLASTVYSKAYWTGGGTYGTQEIITGINGIMRLSTTNTGNRSSSLTFANDAFHNDGNWVFEAAIKTNALTSRKINVGMYKDSNDYIMFEFDTADDAAKIYLVTKNNGSSEVSEDTGKTLIANCYYVFRIEAHADNTFELYINGDQVLETHTGTIADVAFKPYFYIDNKTANQENLLDIDYVKIWQDR